MRTKIVSFITVFLLVGLGLWFNVWPYFLSNIQEISGSSLSTESWNRKCILVS
jgi:hypothetical protein